MNAAGAIALFVITTKTKEHGEAFVVREHVWRGTKSFPTLKPVAVSTTVEEARRALHAKAGRGLEQLVRQRKDGPELVECWGSPLVVAFLRHQGKLT